MDVRRTQEIGCFKLLCTRCTISRFSVEVKKKERTKGFRVLVVQDFNMKMKYGRSGRVTVIRKTLEPVVETKSLTTLPYD